MPVYEYRCLDCDEKFEVVETFAEHETHEPDEATCPKCGKDALGRQRQMPNPRPGCCENRIGDGCARRGKAYLTDTGRKVLRLDGSHLDIGDFVHPHHGVVVVVGLLHFSARDVDALEV